MLALSSFSAAAFQAPAMMPAQPAAVRLSADLEMMARAPPARKPVAKKPVAARKPVARKPVAKKPVARQSSSVSASGEIGVLPPLGLFDPLGFMGRGPETYRRYQEIEIKHGRLAMAATLGVIVTEAGLRLPGNLAYGLPFSEVAGGVDSYFEVPLAGWLQIVCLIAALDQAVFRQLPENDAGDVAGELPIDWVRYDDPEVKRFKLNAERQNGRAAMFGIIGMISHTALGQDALFPIVTK
jgi:light-harvesting complex I chlorophyll a/b binding protein 1